MAILDTDILVALLKGAPQAVQKVTALEQSGEPLLTTIITAYELLKGAYISQRREENIGKVTDSLSSMQILDLSFNACQEAAKIYKELKEQGTLIGEFDILIAAIARANNQALITRDEHFKLLTPPDRLIKW